MAPILGIWASSRPTVVPDLGSMFPLGVFTLSSAQANIEFTNIPQTYTHLQIRGISRNALAALDVNVLTIRFNSDSGSNYARHYIVGTGSGTPTSSGQSTQTIGWLGDVPANNNTASSFGACVVDILDYRNTSKNKTVRSLSGADLNGSGQMTFFSTLWMNSASPITSITIGNTGGNFVANSSFALYGIK